MNIVETISWKVFLGNQGMDLAYLHINDIKSCLPKIFCPIEHETKLTSPFYFVVVVLPAGRNLCEFGCCICHF